MSSGVSPAMTARTSVLASSADATSRCATDRRTASDAFGSMSACASTSDGRPPPLLPCADAALAVCRSPTSVPAHGGTSTHAGGSLALTKLFGAVLCAGRGDTTRIDGVREHAVRGADAATLAAEASGENTARRSGGPARPLRRGTAVPPQLSGELLLVDAPMPLPSASAAAATRSAALADGVGRAQSAAPRSSVSPGCVAASRRACACSASRASTSMRVPRSKRCSAVPRAALTAPGTRPPAAAAAMSASGCA
eukprot:366319-Chlamydomonas_euryale.AAC.2